VGDDADVLPRDGPTDGDFDGFGDELQVVGHIDGYLSREVVAVGRRTVGIVT
jgi:hypothetical protein